jgi:hypothetical protein
MIGWRTEKNRELSHAPRHSLLFLNRGGCTRRWASWMAVHMLALSSAALCRIRCCCMAMTAPFPRSPATSRVVCACASIDGNPSMRIGALREFASTPAHLPPITCPVKERPNACAGNPLRHAWAPAAGTCTGRWNSGDQAEGARAVSRSKEEQWMEGDIQLGHTAPSTQVGRCLHTTLYATKLARDAAKNWSKHNIGALSRRHGSSGKCCPSSRLWRRAISAKPPRRVPAAVSALVHACAPPKGVSARSFVPAGVLAAHALHIPSLHMPGPNRASGRQNSAIAPSSTNPFYPGAVRCAHTTNAKNEHRTCTGAPG